MAKKVKKIFVLMSAFGLAGIVGGVTESCSNPQPRTDPIDIDSIIKNKILGSIDNNSDSIIWQKIKQNNASLPNDVSQDIFDFKNITDNACLLVVRPGIAKYTGSINVSFTLKIFKMDGSDWQGHTNDVLTCEAIVGTENVTILHCGTFDQMHTWIGRYDADNLVIPNKVQSDDGDIYTVASISTSAFVNSQLTGSLSFPNSLISIKNSAFSASSNLTGKLVIPNSVTEINGMAFRCSKIETLELNNGTANIADGAFQLAKLNTIITNFDQEPTYSNSIFFQIPNEGIVTNTKPNYTSQNLLEYLKTHCSLPDGWEAR